MNSLLSRTACLFTALALLTFGSVPSFAQVTAEVDTAFAQANKAYDQGKYAEAAADYEAIAKQAGFSSPLFFNLGNAWLAQKKYGLAILSYQRALRLAPTNPDIQANLRLAHQGANLPEPQVSWWMKIVYSLTANQWAYLVSAIFATLCLVSAASYLRPQMPSAIGMAGSNARRFWQVVVLFLAVDFFIAASATAFAITDRNDGIVLAPDVSVLLSPWDGAKPIYTLKEGETVMVEKEREGFLFVRDHQGRPGWVSDKLVQPVETHIL